MRGWPTWRPVWSVRARLTLWYTAMLLVLLLVTCGLSYALLDRALLREVDNSLLTVAKVIRGVGRVPGQASPASEVMLQTVLGPGLADKVFQLSDSSGQPAVRSSRLEGTVLPLSAPARAAAARGRQTFETVELERGGTARLLTLPVMQDKRLGQIIQVGLSMARVEHTLGRYLDTLVLLVPVAMLLSVAGGAAIAGLALRPVDEMSHAARRISAEDLGQRLAVRGTRDELDHLAGTLNGMLDRLEETFHQMKRFSADAAHELRTPLTALKGGIEVALRTPRSAETYRDVLASSLEEVDRLIRLAEDLLVLSRLGRREPAARERVELEALVLEVADVGAQLGLPAGVGVTVKETTPVAVLGEPTALRRAALNLVDNAVRYTPAGGAVELTLAAVDGEAVLTVRDTGIGLSPAEIAVVFEPFVRGEAAPARNPAGTGLGLAITRSVAQAHGGTVTLESAPGRGCTSALRLPLAS